ncbi:flagella synthesis chaperone protein FlgN [Ferrigenium kumadai]|uniref:Flagella synthesis chaperone protein FlgN n=1 Tax=Ferrigenium kumadai TaxID=1682490 RepID=A0AAN1SXK8_9PROT|nr:flagellar protein FlgN [Ferrigenium kumadai]BBI98753.1 flagella synthesis chaperone protein FlgN [Ferrigenium kumadai]
MKHASPLLAALTAERAALQKFVALLEREQVMLVENHTDQLLELSEQKSQDALELNKLAEARRALLKQHLPQLTVEAIRAWLETHSREGLAVWQEVLSLAERAQLLNNANGAVIQMQLRHNQQTLAVLSNAVNKANLYGPDGQPSFSPGSGRSLGSG